MKGIAGNTQQSHMEFWKACGNGGDKYGSMDLSEVGNALPYIYTSTTSLVVVKHKH